MKIFTPDCKEYIFLTIHNILPTEARLQICNQTKDLFCNYCLPKQIETVMHIYCCPVFKSAIKWFQRKIIKIDSNIKKIPLPDFYSFNFKLKQKKKHNSFIWLLANFLYHLWKVRRKNVPDRMMRHIINGMQLQQKILKNNAFYKQNF